MTFLYLVTATHLNPRPTPRIPPCARARILFFEGKEPCPFLDNFFSSPFPAVFFFLPSRQNFFPFFPLSEGRSFPNHLSFPVPTIKRFFDSTLQHSDLFFGPHPRLSFSPCPMTPSAWEMPAVFNGGLSVDPAFFIRAND